MHRLISKLSRLFFTWRYQGKFKLLGRHAYIFSPFRVDGIESISLGERSVMQSNVWIYCVGLEGDQPALLSIGEGCVFGYNNHITAVKKVEIGNYVLTANNVYISDNVHGYEDISIPVMHQTVRCKQPVSIGDGSWIGENACIIGASIGKNCVIGANAVVTRDIPDYCVAVGVPARVIRRFDHQLKSWIDNTDQ